MPLAMGPLVSSLAQCSALVWSRPGLVGCTVMRDPSYQSRYSLIFQEAHGQQMLGEYSLKGPLHPKVTDIASQAQ